MAFVAPIEVPNRKIGLNAALQCNFNLPYTPKEFESPLHWATRSLDKKEKGTSDNKSKRSISAMESCRDESAMDPKQISFDDLPAEDFYSLVGHYLQMYVLRVIPFCHPHINEIHIVSRGGFEEDCLEKAICEMSKHPLEHQHDNLMSELMHFVFRWG